jgi:hypothetical protein
MLGVAGNGRQAMDYEILRANLIKQLDAGQVWIAKDIWFRLSRLAKTPYQQLDVRLLWCDIAERLEN